jgi:hypothetical protein
MAPTTETSENVENRESKRVVFTFDPESYDIMKKMTEEAGFRSMAETVREALRITRALQEQAKEGYKEITLRNPEKNRERTLVIPHLARFAHGPAAFTY